MGFPAIVYNNKTLSFDRNPFDLSLDYPRTRIVNMSPSKNREAIDISPDDVMSFSYRWFKNSDATQATFKRNLFQWAEWAMACNPWTFARDSAKTVNTTLNGGASAGDSTVTVTSVTGITIGNQYVLRSKTAQEIVKVSGISSSTLTLTETLNSDFANGIRFRDEQFWPAYLINTKSPVTEHPQLWYDVDIQFSEDVNSL